MIERGRTFSETMVFQISCGRDELAIDFCLATKSMVPLSANRDGKRPEVDMSATRGQCKD